MNAPIPTNRPQRSYRQMLLVRQSLLAMVVLLLGAAVVLTLYRVVHEFNRRHSRPVPLMALDEVIGDLTPQAQTPAPATAVSTDAVPASPTTQPAADAEPSSPAKPSNAAPTKPRINQPSLAAARENPKAAVVKPKAPKPVTFDGRPLKRVGAMRMVVTAYSPDERSCGDSADGITASGHSVWTNGMKLVAADKRFFRFGSLISIPGYHGGRPVPVLDRGGAIKGYRLDVLFPTHEQARAWGKRTITVTLWDYADRK